MALPGPLPELFEHIDTNKDRYIEILKEAVAIKSVSSSPAHRQTLIDMVKWTAERFDSLGVQCQLADIGTHTLPDGTELPLPPVLLGTLGEDPAKLTVCVYCHLDVQPASIEDGWNTDPWELTEKDGKLYGRGASDDKGPALCWQHVIEAYQTVGIDIPINLKFVFEGMEESGSFGLDELLRSLTDTFLADVDFVCITDTYWLGNNKPCITYGLRGNVYFGIEVECAKKDLHSGGYGGSLPEAMSDVVYLMNTLVDKDGTILVPNFMDDVAPLTPKEEAMYDNIDFDVEQFRDGIGCRKLLHNEDRKQILMHRWRYPCLSLHGIEGAHYGPGAKTVIPGKITGKVSVRIVDNQNPQKIGECVIKHLDAQWEKRGSTNVYRSYVMKAGNSWLADPFHPHFDAGVRATQHVYNMSPDFTREGGSIPITLTLQETTRTNVMLLAIGAGDDAVHSQNEKIDIRNYIGGIKLMAAYIYEVSLLEKPEKIEPGAYGISEATHHAEDQDKKEMWDNSKCKSHGRNEKCIRKPK